MTVGELIEKLRAFPQDMQVLIPDDWERWPYTFLQGIEGIREVTTDSPDGGTFNWGWDKTINLDLGFECEGVCLMPEAE